MGLSLLPCNFIYGVKWLLVSFIQVWKAGATTHKKEKEGTVQVVTDLATAIASALSPQASSSIPMSCTLGRLPGPAKMIEGRSKCYKQLRLLSVFLFQFLVSFCIRFNLRVQNFLGGDPQTHCWDAGAPFNACLTLRLWESKGVICLAQCDQCTPLYAMDESLGKFMKI